MKRIAASLLAAVSLTAAFTNPPGTQWWSAQLHGSGSVGLSTLDFAGRDTGWAVGGVGYIMKTVNGGNTWTLQQNPLLATGTVNLGGVAALSSQTVWAAGTKGTLIKTTDGGTNWVVQDIGTTTNFYDLQFVNASIGYAMGDSVVYKTTNGGTTWSGIPYGLNFDANAIHFSSVTTGWTVGWDGKMAKTTNGGASWTLQTDIGNTYSYYGVHFPNDSTGWAVGDGGKVRRTTNGGISWTTQTTDAPFAQFLAVRFLNANTGWLYGPGIYKTTNAGANWIAQTADSMSISAGATDFHIFDSVTVVAAGGGIAKTPALLNLTYPTGGQAIASGSVLPITWTSANIPNLIIHYSTNNGTNWLTVTAITNAATGVYNWDVPSSLAGNAFKIRIGNTGTFQTSQSSSAFSFVSLALTAPGFLSKWRGGSVRNITWTSSGVGTRVKLEYSLDTGSTWKKIADSITTSLGTYAWTLPDTNSSFAKIRISETGNPGLYATGNTFTIAKLRITSPNGSEIWAREAAHPITWIASADITLVNLQYSLNNGSSWVNITPNFGTSANPATYSWTIPTLATNGNQYRIRIQDNSYPDDVFDVSDTTFTITNLSAIAPGMDPSRFGLFTNDPTRIQFNLPEAESNVRLDVLDASGTLVATLVNGARNAGTHVVGLAGVPSGVYTYRLRAGNKEITRRVPLVR